MSRFEIRFAVRAKRELEGLTAIDRRRSIERGLGRLAAGDPSIDVRKLGGSATERRLRVGDWRVVYEQIGTTILVAKIDRRDDVYRK